MTFAGQMWERYGRLTVADIPDDVRRLAAQGILDWAGCAFAGTGEPLARILRDEFAEEQGPATVFGRAAGARPGVAALINGATGHALDYDDTNTAGGFHSSAPILPAALAQAQDSDRTGAELLAAYVVGVEVGSRFGGALGLDHYARGWHSTSTVGVFGAAAAAAHVLCLDREQFVAALGVAASMSSGVQSNIGTMTKPLHAGHAAERGVLAARLAARGYTAREDAFEDSSGLVVAAGIGTIDQERLDVVEGFGWAITETLYKYHAACHGTHAPLESVLRLMQDTPVESIRSMQVRIHPAVARVCRIAVPRAGLEAKFSIRGAVALALLGENTADPAIFSDERVRSPEVVGLMQRIDVVEDAENLTNTGAIVRAQTADGPRETSFDIGRPDHDLDRQEQRLRAKFELIAGPVVGADRAKELQDRLLDVASTSSVRELFR